MSDARPPLDAPQRAFGVAARVTIPGGAPVTTTVIGLPERTIQVEIGSNFTATETRKVFGLARAVIPHAPERTMIEILDGLEAGTYYVDRLDISYPDELRVLAVTG